MDPMDRALVNAVHALANKRLQAAVNAARAAAQNTNSATIRNLQARLAEAQNPARIATQVENRPVNETMQKNVNRLLELIEQKAFNRYINQPNFNITKNPNYNNSRKAAINAALQRRRNNLRAPPPLPHNPSAPTNSLINL
jgi:hypothetical protein